jgi:iron complex transport system substrate-binding protein
VRIVTLLPSATEIVCALGLEDHLVGVSHSCDFPARVRNLPKMTSTRVPVDASSNEIDEFVRDHLSSETALYDLNLKALEAAAPDVVVSQALCDVCAVATGEVDEAICALPKSPTLIDLTPNTLDDVLADIARVAEAADAEPAADDLLRNLKMRRDVVAERTASVPAELRPGVAFLEWLIPPFNGGHWNPELVAIAGGIDLLGSPAQPSRTLDWPEIIETKPEVLFIACCGFDRERAMQDVRIAQQRPEWASIPAVANDRVYVADGNAYFASPGPRLIDGLEILAHALHPGLHPLVRSDATVIVAGSA